MKIKYYRYPDSMQKVKTGSKLSIVFLLTLLILTILGYIPEDKTNPINYYFLIIGLPLTIVGVIFYIGGFPDIGVTDDGVIVELFWLKLKVQWDDIAIIKPFGPRFLRWWVVITKKNLTPFHRFYGMFSFKSFLPSFYIQTSSRSHQYLVRKIKEEIKKT